MRNIKYTSSLGINKMPSGRIIKGQSGLRTFEKSVTSGITSGTGSARDQRKLDRLLVKENNLEDGESLGEKQQSKLEKLKKSVYAGQDAETIDTNLAIRSSDLNAAGVGSKSSFGDKFQSGAFGNEGTGILGGISTAANGISAIGQMNSKVDVNPAQQAAKDMLTSVASKFGPWGQAAAAAYKIVDAVGNMTGTNLDALNSDQAEAAGISGAAKFANNAMGVLAPLAGLFTGDTIDAYNSRDVQELSNAYGGTSSDINTAGTMGGKSYLFGKRKANKFIGEQNANVDTITALNRTNSMRKNSNYGMDLMAQNNDLYSGKSFADKNYVGKNGLKMISAEQAKLILALRKHEFEDIPQFQFGGVIGVDTNILPDGALHKDLNHLEDVNPEVGEEVTRKGIPVIVTDEKGNIEQVAEIEREEIIFRKEITKKLEELWKEGSEESMIKAGKILAEEIITNTQDNTGQIEEN